MLASAIALGLVTSAARADLVTTVTPIVAPAAGGYSYTYLVTNTPASTVDVGAFYLGVSDDADLSDITMPAGFLTLYTTGFETIEFASTDSSTDITPGSSDVFSFVSPLPPETLSYANQSYDDGEFNTGTTLGPISVPEPLSLGSMFVGAVLLTRRATRTNAAR